MLRIEYVETAPMVHVVGCRKNELMNEFGQRCVTMYSMHSSVGN